MAMKPEEFAHGVAQAFGKAPVERVSTLPQRPVVDRMIEQIDKAWPPPRYGKFQSLQQNDPVVVKFLVELFGPMLGKEEANEVPRDSLPAEMRGHRWNRPLLSYQGHGEDWHGGDGQFAAVWAPADFAWRLTYESGKLDYECYRRPSDEDLAKLCFAVGWFSIRTDNHFYQHKPHLWRRGNIMASEGPRKKGAR